MASAGPVLQSGKDAFKRGSRPMRVPASISRISRLPFPPPETMTKATRLEVKVIQRDLADNGDPYADL
jgi:hypothetical protein